jgi:hypothetical protein
MEEQKQQLVGQGHENFEHAGQLTCLPKNRSVKSFGEFYLSENWKFSSNNFEVYNDSIVTCVGTLHH